MHFFEREYYSLDRAAKELDCDTDDIIHLGVIGAIEICIKLNGFPSSLWISGAIEKEITDIISERASAFRFNITKPK